MDLISIIIPIYNVEAYLKKCINSIINQSYTNLEIILVNDGSPDSCPEICDEYAKVDNRIKVIHKANGGLSEARNAGLDIAKGSFIGFVDSDDYVHLDMYKELYENMMRTGSDISECAVEQVYSNKKIDSSNNEVRIYSGKEALKIHLEGTGNGHLPRTAVWSKLFKKELIHDMRFPVGEIHEDYFFTCQALYNSKIVCIVDKCLYHHIYTNTSSITSAKFNTKDLYKEVQYKKRMEFLKNENAQELYSLAEKRYYELLLGLYYQTSREKLVESKELERKLKVAKPKINELKLSELRKFEYHLFYVHPLLYIAFKGRLKGIKKMVQFGE